MGNIATCPACATSFRVVPDLLRISNGWVRCGKCAEVFDANAALHRSDGCSVADLQAQRPVEPEAVDQPGAAEDAYADEMIKAAPAAVSDPEPIAPLDAPVTMQERVEPSLEPDPQAPPSFMLSGAEEPRRSKFGSALLWLMLALAAMALALQMVYQERDRMAAMFPQSRSFLVMACEHLECTVGPVKHIESVVIEASSFNRVRADNYRLVVTMRNTSSVEVALPALDLSLTDSADQMVMRRVFLPQEFAPGVGVLAPRAEWSGQVSMQVRQTPATEKFTGYRLYAFYP